MSTEDEIITLVKLQVDEFSLVIEHAYLCWASPTKKRVDVINNGMYRAHHFNRYNVSQDLKLNNSTNKFENQLDIITERLSMLHNDFTENKKNEFKKLAEHIRFYSTFDDFIQRSDQTCAIILVKGVGILYTGENPREIDFRKTVTGKEKPDAFTILMSQMNGCLAVPHCKELSKDIMKNESENERVLFCTMDKGMKYEDANFYLFDTMCVFEDKLTWLISQAVKSANPSTWTRSPPDANTFKKSTTSFKCRKYEFLSSTEASPFQRIVNRVDDDVYPYLTRSKGISNNWKPSVSVAFYFTSKENAEGLFWHIDIFYHTDSVGEEKNEIRLSLCDLVHDAQFPLFDVANIQKNYDAKDEVVTFYMNPSEHIKFEHKHSAFGGFFDRMFLGKNVANARKVPWISPVFLTHLSSMYNKLKIRDYPTLKYTDSIFGEEEEEKGAGFLVKEHQNDCELIVLKSICPKEQVKWHDAEAFKCVPVFYKTEEGDFKESCLIFSKSLAYGEKGYTVIENEQGDNQDPLGSSINMKSREYVDILKRGEPRNFTMSYDLFLKRCMGNKPIMNNMSELKNVVSVFRPAQSQTSANLSSIMYSHKVHSQISEKQEEKKCNDFQKQMFCQVDKEEWADIMSEIR